MLALATNAGCVAILFGVQLQLQSGGKHMSANSYVRPRSLLAAGAAVVAGAAVWLALPDSDAGAAGTQAAAATTPTAAAAKPVAATSDPNAYPFGAPRGGVAVKVPP